MDIKVNLYLVLNMNLIVDNNHDIECKVVPDPELGDVGVTIKRTLEVKDVWQDLCNNLKFETKEKWSSQQISQSRIEWLGQVLSWLWLGAESDTASQLLLMWQQGWGKQVVVTVAAAIAVEDNDAHDNVG